MVRRNPAAALRCLCELLRAQKWQHEAPRPIHKKKLLARHAASTGAAQAALSWPAGVGSLATGAVPCRCRLAGAAAQQPAPLWTCVASLLVRDAKKKRSFPWRRVNCPRRGWGGALRQRRIPMVSGADKRRSPGQDSLLTMVHLSSVEFLWPCSTALCTRAHVLYKKLAYCLIHAPRDEFRDQSHPFVRVLMRSISYVLACQGSDEIQLVRIGSSMLQQ